MRHTEPGCDMLLYDSIIPVYLTKHEVENGPKLVWANSVDPDTPKKLLQLS